MSSRPKTWVEISASALRHNLRQARHWVGGREVIPVVKANAYGHGLVCVVEALRYEQVPFFAVDSIEEAREIASVNATLPVLLLGYVQQSELAEVIARGWSFVCSKRETLEAALRYAVRDAPAKVHLEVETGLHRLGADEAEFEALLSLAGEHRERVCIEGVCSHFASAEQVPEAASVDEQLRVFTTRHARMVQDGWNPVWQHIACSAALWLWPQTWQRAGRLGISLYGIWSSDEVRRALGSRVDVRPVMAWKTLIAECKTVPQGGGIGYGATEQAAQAMRIAVLPVGYADGFDRRMSSSGEVLIRGVRCRVVGRVCMNMCMVDISAVPEARLEDEVVIWGEQEGDRLGPGDWEAHHPTLIAYEAVARVRATIARRLVEDERS